MFPLCSDLRSPRKIREVLLSNCDLSSLNICYSLFETVHISFPFLLWLTSALGFYKACVSLD